MPHSQESISLKALLAAPVNLTVGAVVLSIKPLSWYDSIEAIDAIAPALSSMPILPGVGDLSTVDVGAWTRWCAANRDAVTQFAHLASGQDAEAIEGLSPAHLIELLFGLLEINADFFVQGLPQAIERVSDRAAGLMQRVQGVMQETASRGPSSASSATATATPT
jgi:hypothetical protein